jgi:hypothetical protein
MTTFLTNVLSRGAAYLGLTDKIPPTISQLVSPKSSLEGYFVDMFLGHSKTRTTPCKICGCDCCRVLTGEDPRYEGHCDEWRDCRRWIEEMCAELDAVRAEEGFVVLGLTGRKLLI